MMERKGTRLRRNADFLKVRAEGRTWVHSLVVLQARPNSLSCNRFGFSVSKRIGGAVVRNRAKRLLREAVRAAAVEMTCCWDLVFIARHPIVDAGFREVAEAVDTLLRRASLLGSEATRDHPIEQELRLEEPGRNRTGDSAVNMA